MFLRNPSHSTRHSRRSSALVITLAALVLISGLLLLFLNQSTLNRQISFSSAGQYRANLVAHAAMDTIIGDLRTEIVSGSTTYTSNNFSLYLPITNLTAVPCRVSDQGFANLVKQSASTSNFWTGTYYDQTVVNPIRSATNNATETPSANGSSIKVNRWNKAGLLGDPGSGTTPQIPNNYIPPDWILITRQGAVTNASTLAAIGPGPGTLSDKSVNNPNYVIGRYAYTIYDEGGLLDVNVAGYPSSLSGTDFSTKRGLLPQMDLANIPGIDTDANANSFVQWRNVATAASANAYTNYVFTATNGFTAVAIGDQAFVNRQDLIDYVRANPGQVATSALQYLGTFTRELNAPSYTPPALGSATRPYVVDPGGLTVSQQTSLNPSLINIRVVTAFQRNSDLSQAVVGEPLIKYRFPLSRLNWIGHTGPNGATAQQIYNSFGLTWSPSITDSWSHTVNPGWIYNHGSSSTILTLDKLANGADPNAPHGREPDFFELLQAGIWAGSLGKTISAQAQLSNLSTLDASTFSQIIQIGANLIDQCNTNSFPTHVSFNNMDFYGIKNLPYLAGVYDTPYRFHGLGQPANDPNIGLWYQPLVWRPHAAGINPSVPQQFRFIVVGTVRARFYYDNASNWNQTGQYNDTAPTSLNSSSGIQFSVTSQNTFTSPTLLSPSVGASASGNNSVSDGGLTNFDGLTNFVGIWTGTANEPDVFYDPTSSNSFRVAEIIPFPTVNHILQYLDGTNWITYDVMRQVANDVGCTDDAGPYGADGFETYLPRTFTIRPDPRSDRFGVTYGWSSPNYKINETIRPDAGSGYPSYYESYASSGWTFSAGSFTGALSDNKTNSATFYADPDGIVRPGEGAYADGNASDGGYPIASDSFNSVASRPIILNRAFRSVADMGYASRGMPWKSLDFFTAQSADSALLDLFCVNEPALPTSPATAAPPEAGRLDLNSRQGPVLAAVLTGAIKSDVDGTTITPAEASGLATSLTNLTMNPAQGPIINKAELATRLAPSLSYGSVPDTIIKRRREAAVRALADVGNTRTWNLLIDVIAQSGRYTALSANLNQFNVEGERHYWLHVAIDRYTGKVIQQCLEPVSE